MANHMISLITSSTTNPIYEEIDSLWLLPMSIRVIALFPHIIFQSESKER